MADVGNTCVLSSKICNQVFEMFLIRLPRGTLDVKSCKMNQGKNGLWMPEKETAKNTLKVQDGAQLN